MGVIDVENTDPKNSAWNKANTWIAVGALLLSAGMAGFQIHRLNQQDDDIATLRGLQKRSIEQVDAQLKRDAATIRYKATLMEVDEGTGQSRVLGATTDDAHSGRGQNVQEPMANVADAQGKTGRRYYFDLAVTNVGARVAYVDGVAGALFGGGKESGTRCHQSAPTSAKEAAKKRDAEVKCASYVRELSVSDFKCGPIEKDGSACMLPIDIEPGPAKHMRVDLTEYLVKNELHPCLEPFNAPVGKLELQIDNSVDNPYPGEFTPGTVKNIETGEIGVFHIGLANVEAKCPDD